MQPLPEPTPVPPQGSGAGPGLDIGQIVNGIVNGLLQGLGDTLTVWLSAFSGNVAVFLRDTISNLWNGFWHSGANLLDTPLELTRDFPPARQLGGELISVVYAIAVIAVVLLGLRTLWRNLSASAGALSDAVDGVLFGMLLASVSTLIVAQAKT